FRIMPVFTTKYYPVGIPGMVVIIQVLGIIVSCNIQGIRIAGLVRHGYTCQPGSYRTGLIVLSNYTCQTLGNVSKPHGVGSIFLIPSKNGLGKSCFTTSIQYRMGIGVV